MNRFIPVLAVLAACSFSNAVAAKDGPNMDEILSNFVAAYNASDAGRLSRLYSEDAAIYPPGSDRIEGRAEIESYFADVLSRQRPTGLEAMSDEHRQLGDAYLDMGSYDMKIVGVDGRQKPVSGNFAHYVENINGKWLIIRDIWNQNVPEGQ